MSAGWAAFPGGKQPDDDMGKGLVEYIWILAGVSAVVIALRLFVVRYILKKVRISDYLMFASFLFIVVGGSVMTRAVHWGLGRHIYYLTPDQIMNILMYSVILVGPITLSVVLGRASFCFFLLSTIGTSKPVRRLLWAALISQALVNISLIILQYTSCGSHVSAIWDITIHAKCVSYGTIVDYLYFISAWNAFIDLFLTILPAVLLKDLQIEWRRKALIMILLCISIFAFIASLVKCILTSEMKNPDVTWSIAKLNFLVMGEAYVIIIVASMPLMNKLISWGRETISARSYGTSEGTEQKQASAQQTWAAEQEDTVDSAVPSDHV